MRALVLGTPYMNAELAVEVKANMSPLFCGKENVLPEASCKKTSSREAPNDAPIVKSSFFPSPPYAWLS